MRSRHYYELEWLDPDYMAAHPDCDLALAARNETFASLDLARGAATDKTKMARGTVQLRRVDVIGERYRGDPLADYEYGEPEEFEWSGK